MFIYEDGWLMKHKLISAVQDQITEDVFPGEEEEVSSADKTPSVTSNTSDLLRCLQGNTHTKSDVYTWLHNI